MILPEYNPDPNHVRALLDEAGLSQRKAAKLLKIADRTMRHWCAGNVDIPYPSLLALYLLVLLSKFPIVGQKLQDLKDHRY